MKNYLLFAVFFLGISTLVTIEHQKHADRGALVDRDRPVSSIAPSDTPKAQSNQSNPEWYSPSGDIAWQVFGWPNGITVWALLMTMLVIADQTNETRKAAEAANRGIALTVNEKRPRLLLQPQPFTHIVNGFPNVEIRVTNIGGSKAIFGLCIAGMEATGLEEVSISRKPANAAMLKKLTNGIVPSGGVHEERIELFSSSEIFPPGLDKSKPYKLHIFGSLNFRDVISEDAWVRDFHYVLVSMEDIYMVQFGKRSSEFWMSMMQEEDIKRGKQSGWKLRISWIRRSWASYKSWIEKQKSDSQ